MNKQIVSKTRIKCARSRSMRIQHRHVQKETTTTLQNTTTDTKGISYTRDEQKKPPPWWRETGSPRVLLLCRFIQYNSVPLQRFEPKTKKDSCRVYASQVGQSTPSRIRRGPCLAGDRSIQKKEYIRVEGSFGKWRMAKTKHVPEHLPPAQHIILMPILLESLPRLYASLLLPYLAKSTSAHVRVA
jgi:hypothetical protein